MKKSFGVIGGDRRQKELAHLLEEDGQTVYTYGVPGMTCMSLEQAASAEVILLPLPLCKETGVLNCEEHPMLTRDLFCRFHQGQRLLAGQVKEAQRREAETESLTLEDYFLREELTVANAAITAESAIRVAMGHLDCSLLGMRALVLGFGRIGKLLAHRLHGLGVEVAATARKQEDLAWIRAYGWRALETGGLDGKLESFDLVFNTIPSLVLDESLIRQLPKHCLLIDLASVQGIDAAAVGERPYEWARLLPGRLAPRTAAAAIRNTVYHILEA